MGQPQRTSFAVPKRGRRVVGTSKREDIERKGGGNRPKKPRSGGNVQERRLQKNKKETRNYGICNSKLIEGGGNIQSRKMGAKEKT